MTRVILFLMALSLAVLAVAAVQALLRTPRFPLPTAKETTMPALVSLLSYVLLIVLMFGVTTGWLGGP